MSSRWQLIQQIDGTGIEQMAIDSWLLNQHASGLIPSCLRFYTWRSPTLSLGYHQRQFPQRWKDLQWKGQPVELVRRPTGGRAVLHQGDLTYALITSGMKGSRRAVYQQLCQFLIQGWRSLGINLSFGEAGRGYIKNPNCFGTATAADLVTENGYKLIGSAQVYRNGCVLQHGSMRLNPDAALFEEVFGESLVPPNLPQHHQAIASALEEAAKDCFGIEFEERSLSSTEIAAARSAYSVELE